MSTFEIRSFRRSDRDHLARLVNAHAAAVIPGAHASVNTVLQQLEREPGEFIVDPWVDERVALVAEHDGAITAAALLVRYRDDADVGASFRGACEVRWLVFWPTVPAGNPHWHDGNDAARALLAAALSQCRRWRATTVFAGGSLPHPGVYGVPAQWPHVEQLLEAAGFVHTGGTQVVLLADVAAIEPAGDPPNALTTRRSLGINGTRITAEVDGRAVGYLEVDHLGVERFPRSGWADIGNLVLGDGPHRDELGDFLIRSAASWLRLGQTDRLLAYGLKRIDAPFAGTPVAHRLRTQAMKKRRNDWSARRSARLDAAAKDAADLAMLRRNGFVDVTTTRVGWVRSDPA